MPADPPAADPAGLLALAQVWRTAAAVLERAGPDADAAARRVTADSAGAAVFAFADRWRPLGGRGGLIAASAHRCRELADGLTRFANEVTQATPAIVAAATPAARNQQVAALREAAGRSPLRTLGPLPDDQPAFSLLLPAYQLRTDVPVTGPLAGFDVDVPAIQSAAAALARAGDEIHATSDGLRAGLSGRAPWGGDAPGDTFAHAYVPLANDATRAYQRLAVVVHRCGEGLGANAAAYTRGDAGAASIFGMATDPLLVLQPSALVPVPLPLLPTLAEGRHDGRFDYHPFADSYGSGLGTARWFDGSGVYADGDQTPWASTGMSSTYRSVYAYPYLVDTRLRGLIGAPTTYTNESSAGITSVDLTGLLRRSDTLTSGTDMVTLSIGGNDIGFGDTAKACFTGDCTGAFSEADVSKKVATLGERVRPLYDRISQTAPNARVYVTGYPNPLGSDDTWGTITPVERTLAGAATERANAELRRQVQLQGPNWTYVAPDAAFARRAEQANQNAAWAEEANRRQQGPDRIVIPTPTVADPLMNGLRVLGPGGILNSAHPNRAGQQRQADSVLRAAIPNLVEDGWIPRTVPKPVPRR